MGRSNAHPDHHKLLRDFDGTGFDESCLCSDIAQVDQRLLMLEDLPLHTMVLHRNDVHLQPCEGASSFHS